jgi:endonuclease/exonuclease/phosphatase family metal-dependent hydrolase
VVFWQRIPLASPQRGRERNAVWVQVSYQGRNLQVLVTHLDRQGDRQSQLQAVTKLFLALAEPCLLLGDLNCGEEDDAIKNLLATTGVQDPVKDCLGKATPARIDWILSRGMRGIHASVCDYGASDHPCFRVELEAPAGL